MTNIVILPVEKCMPGHMLALLRAYYSCTDKGWGSMIPRAKDQLQQEIAAAQSLLYRLWPNHARRATPVAAQAMVNQPYLSPADFEALDTLASYIPDTDTNEKQTILDLAAWAINLPN